MTRMYKESGGYMDCNNPNEVKRAESKGWVIVPEKAPPPVKKAPVKKRARKTK